MANVIDFSDGSEYVIYQNSGKTYIGKFYKISDVEKDIPAQIQVTGGVHDSLGYDTNCYYVENPALIEADLTIPASGSAELSWKITPVFFKDLISSSESDYSSVFFTYPKSQIAICNIGGSVIDETLMRAYKELCE